MIVVVVVLIVVTLMLLLHLSVVRAQKEEKRLRDWVWANMNDAFANPSTKLENDGCLIRHHFVKRTVARNLVVPSLVMRPSIRIPNVCE